MNLQELQNQIDVLNQKTKVLSEQSIGVKIDPQTALYLTKFINDILVLIPTQTYSTVAPVTPLIFSSIPVGSLWLRDTGTLATNTIHVWTGLAWSQLK